MPDQPPQSPPTDVAPASDTMRLLTPLFVEAITLTLRRAQSLDSRQHGPTICMSAVVAAAVEYVRQVPSVRPTAFVQVAAATLSTLPIPQEVRAALWELERVARVAEAKEEQPAPTPGRSPFLAYERALLESIPHVLHGATPAEATVSMLAASLACVSVGVQLAGRVRDKDIPGWAAAASQLLGAVQHLPPPMRDLAERMRIMGEAIMAGAPVTPPPFRLFS